MALTKVSSGLISADASSVDLNIDAGTLYIDATNNRVGIGTSSPTGVLTSYKSTNGDPVLGHFYNDNAGTATEATVYVTNSSTTGDGLFLQTTGTAFTTIGGFVQDSAVLGSGTGASGGLSIMTRANADMRFYTNGHTNERLRIDSSGNVRIGATTGFHKVCIAHDDSNTDIANGYANLELSNPNGTNGTYSRIVFNDAAGGPGSGILGVKLTDTTNNYGQFEFWTRSSSGGSTKMVIDPNGNVGIGTSSPSCKLAVTTSSSGSVVSDIRNSNSGGYGIYLAAASGSAYALAVDSYNNLRRLTVQGNGAIFMPALSYASASTDLNYNTSTGEVFVVTSSRRYKSNIADLDIDISKILSLRPVSYTDNNGGTNAVGLIAEEVHEEIPQLVNYKEIEGYDEIQPDSVKYSTLSVYLLKAIQEQQVLIEQLQAEVALLKGE